MPTVVNYKCIACGDEKKDIPINKPITDKCLCGKNVWRKFGKRWKNAEVSQETIYTGPVRGRK